MKKRNKFIKNLALSLCLTLPAPALYSYNLKEQRHNAGLLFTNFQYKKAISLYTKIITDNKGDAQSLVSRGRCYLKLGKSQQAATDFNHALSIDPKNRMAAKFLHLVKKGRQILRSPFQKSSSYPPKIHRAAEPDKIESPVAKSKMVDLTQELFTIDELLSYRGKIRLALHRGRQAHIANDRENAIKHFNDVIALDSENSLAKKALVKLGYTPSSISIEPPAKNRIEIASKPSKLDVLLFGKKTESEIAKPVQSAVLANGDMTALDSLFSDDEKQKSVNQTLVINKADDHIKPGKFSSDMPVKMTRRVASPVVKSLLKNQKIPDWEEEILKYDGKVRLHLYRGKINRILGKSVASRESFEKALMLDPGNPLAIYSLEQMSAKLPAGKKAEPMQITRQKTVKKDHPIIITERVKTPDLDPLPDLFSPDNEKEVVANPPIKLTENLQKLAVVEVTAKPTPKAVLPPVTKSVPARVLLSEGHLGELASARENRKKNAILHDLQIMNSKFYEINRNRGRKALKSLTIKQDPKLNFIPELLVKNMDEPMLNEQKLESDRSMKPEEQPVTINFPKTSLIDLLKAVAGKSGKHIKTAYPLDEIVSYQRDDVPLASALKDIYEIIEVNGYIYREMENSIEVILPKDEPYLTKIFRLQKTEISTIFPILTKFIRETQKNDKLKSASSGGAMNAGEMGGMGTEATSSSSEMAPSGDEAGAEGGMSGGGEAGMDGGSEKTNSAETGNDINTGSGNTGSNNSMARAKSTTIGNVSLMTYPQTNSLILMGPRSKVEKAEGFLAVLGVKNLEHRLKTRTFTLRYLDYQTFQNLLKFNLPDFSSDKIVQISGKK